MTQGPCLPWLRLHPGGGGGWNHTAGHPAKKTAGLCGLSCSHGAPVAVRLWSLHTCLTNYCLSWAKCGGLDMERRCARSGGSSRCVAAWCLVWQCCCRDISVIQYFIWFVSLCECSSGSDGQVCQCCLKPLFFTSEPSKSSKVRIRRERERLLLREKLN